MWVRNELRSLGIGNYLQRIEPFWVLLFTAIEVIFENE
jgi:hypothetical protein